MSEIKIIAEIGVNHNGDINLAKKLIDISKKCHANYVKFQIFNVDEHINKSTKLAKYQKKNLNTNITQYEMAKKYEFDIYQFKKILSYCKKNKIKFIASCFDVDSLKKYISLGIDTIKIPSGEITNYFLLKQISKLRKKVFLSTGMSNVKEIALAINLLTKNGLKKKK